MSPHPPARSTIPLDAVTPTDPARQARPCWTWCEHIRRACPSTPDRALGLPQKRSHIVSQLPAPRSRHLIAATGTSAWPRPSSTITSARRAAAASRTGRCTRSRPSASPPACCARSATAAALDPRGIDDVVLGCVDPVGEAGGDIARAAALNGRLRHPCAGRADQPLLRLGPRCRELRRRADHGRPARSRGRGRRRGIDEPGGYRRLRRRLAGRPRSWP